GAAAQAGGVGQGLAQVHVLQGGLAVDGVDACAGLQVERGVVGAGDDNFSVHFLVGNGQGGGFLVEVEFDARVSVLQGGDGAGEFEDEGVIVGVGDGQGAKFGAEVLQVDAFLEGEGIVCVDHLIDGVDHALSDIGGEGRVATLGFFEAGGGQAGEQKQTERRTCEGDTH